MVADTSKKLFTISQAMPGLKVKYSGLGANATVYYGQSLIDKLTTFNDFKHIKRQLSTRETTINMK